MTGWGDLRRGVFVMQTIALPDRNIVLPRLEFPRWLRFPRGVSDERVAKMLTPLGGMLSPLGVSVTQTPLLLDLVTGAAAAYSLRKLRTAYAGSAVRVRRSSDSAEQDIGFTSAGDFDTSAFSSFVGGGSGYVKTWYDQSGNGINVSQATAGQQPQIVLNVQNGKAGVLWAAGSSTILTASLSVSLPNTFIGVLQQSVASNQVPYTNGTAAFLYNFSATQGRARSNADLVFTVTITNQNIIIAEFVNGTNTATVRVNGTETVGTTGSAASNGTIAIGGFINSFYWTGYISEVVLFGTSIGASARATADTDINAYYAIY